MSLRRLLWLSVVRARKTPYRLLVLAASTTLVLAAGCGGGGDDPAAPPPDDEGDPPAATTGAIGGQVSAGAEAVAGASIALSGPASRTVTSGADGRYSFTALPVGTYTVALTLPAPFELGASETASKSATVTAGQTATVNFAAQRTGGSPVVEVTLNGTQFSPSELNIAAGTTVRWRVVGGTHTVTPSVPGQTGVWAGTGLMSANDTFEHTFTVAGQTYDYFCQPHQSLGMTGRIVVAP